ncbi:MAG: response regulator [Pseudomonadota bacterium]|jgi:CheY-like chemotaxis protein|uniref:Phosphate regulon transcriptional regulatory protein PhoB (SphR) n=1 Tax=Caballeronia sordidicola TaxID=196367 RepID=A0A242MUS4_CABSO|nr:MULTISPECIES: response regulator [Burkholderiaceae]AMM17191.1 response regulator receiver protein [Burkholderia sp. PAMC 28687]MDP9156872.1 response regulator [Pseudomonadota bacterium]OTP75187.1 Phosphate regulon transcriptional regulatory protein PhoB (SphR) [Caballeronia sordidicola]
MKKILVVDDEFDLLTTWRLVLQMEGYEVGTASNGLQALESARANPPDLIVTDWMMPVMDGLALCHALAADDTLAQIPVILSSAAARTPEVSHPKLEFHRKPLSIDSLIAIVTRLIGPA